MSRTPPGIHVSQLGFPCSARKRIVVPAEAAAGAGEFHLQDMEHSDTESLGAFENWKTVFRGRLERHEGPMGSYLVGDFSALREPGIYRAVLPPRAGEGAADVAAWSFPFPVADGVHARLPSLFLDYMHGQRCGDFENDLRGPCHLDDAVRTDTGAPVDAVGGWHDAGDLRKWMATAVLPILGLFEIRSRLGILPQPLAREAARRRPPGGGCLGPALDTENAGSGHGHVLRGRGRRRGQPQAARA